MVQKREKFKIPYDPGTLNFYCVDQGYVDELKRIDPKIPNAQYEVHNKFMCGVLFEIDGLEYFAPISSFKKTQKTNFFIKNKRGEVVGVHSVQLYVPHCRFQKNR